MQNAFINDATIFSTKPNANGLFKLQLQVEWKIFQSKMWVSTVKARVGIITSSDQSVEAFWALLGARTMAINKVSVHIPTRTVHQFQSPTRRNLFWIANGTKIRPKVCCWMNGVPRPPPPRPPPRPRPKTPMPKHKRATRGLKIIF